MQEKKLAIMIVAITNTPKILDKALIRKDRFDYIFYMDGSDTALVKLFRKELKKEGVKLDKSVKLEDLADYLNNMSPADIVALARRLRDKSIIYNKKDVDLNLILEEIRRIKKENEILKLNFV